MDVEHTLLSCLCCLHLCCPYGSWTWLGCMDWSILRMGSTLFVWNMQCLEGCTTWLFSYPNQGNHLMESYQDCWCCFWWLCSTLEWFFVGSVSFGSSPYSIPATCWWNSRMLLPVSTLGCMEGHTSSRGVKVFFYLHLTKFFYQGPCNWNALHNHSLWHWWNHFCFG